MVSALVLSEITREFIVTRFGEISPLEENFNILWTIFKGSI